MTSDAASRALAAATNDDPRIRQEAALALGTQGDPGHLDRLVIWLTQENDPHVAETLTWAIVRHGNAATPYLVTALNLPDADSRRLTLHALSKIGDPAAFNSIAQHAADSDDAVAGKAWWALVRTDADKAVPLLLPHLGAGDTARRRALTRALVEAGGPAAKALAEHIPTAEGPALTHAVEAAIRIADPENRTIAQRNSQQGVQAIDAALDAIRENLANEVDDTLTLLAAEPHPGVAETAIALIHDRQP